MVSAFSVPKATRQQKQTLNPGPGTYNPETTPQHVKHTDPNYSFGREIRKSQSSMVPGPGSYQPKEGLIIEKHPSFSIMSKRELSSERLNVGPGQYSPTYDYGKGRSPQFTIQQKYGSKEESAPGPGLYQYKSHMASKEKGHDFGKELRSKYEDPKIPGPGSYEYEKATFKYGSKQEPSYGFGSRLAQTTVMKVPGPGSYEPKKEIFSHIGGIVGKDLRDSLVTSRTPGPGNYQSAANYKQKAPTWSLPKANRDYSSHQTYNLGPGQYEHGNGYKKVTGSSPSYNIGGKSQKLKFDFNDVPGPGTYEKELMRSRRSVKIAEKLRVIPGLSVPGPGSYEQGKYDHDSWGHGSGRYSISKEIRIKDNNSFGPGPGQYENKLNQLRGHRGKMSFSKDQRIKYDTNKHPGPGHYDLKPTFADVPKYLLPNV